MSGREYRLNRFRILLLGYLFVVLLALSASIATCIPETTCSGLDSNERVLFASGSAGFAMFFLVLLLFLQRTQRGLSGPK